MGGLMSTCGRDGGHLASSLAFLSTYGGDGSRALTSRQVTPNRASSERYSLTSGEVLENAPRNERYPLITPWVSINPARNERFPEKRACSDPGGADSLPPNHFHPPEPEFAFPPRRLPIHEPWSAGRVKGRRAAAAGGARSPLTRASTRAHFTIDGQFASSPSRPVLRPSPRTPRHTHFARPSHSSIHTPRSVRLVHGPLRPGPPVSHTTARHRAPRPGR